MNLPKTVWLAALGCASTGLAAQFSFNVYSGWDSTVPLGPVRDLAITDDNLKWCLNFNQVVSFNGTNWQVFDTLNTTMPGSAWFQAIESIDNHVWVGTNGAGLFRLDNQGAVTAYNTGNSGLLNDTIMGVEEDHQGELVIATARHLMLFDGSTTWQDIDLSAVGRVFRYTVSSSGDIWAITDSGIAQYDGSWTLHDTVTFAPAYGSHISANSDGIYVGSYLGIKTYAAASWTPISFGGDITSLYADPHGNLWVATTTGFPETSDLHRYDGSSWVWCTQQTYPFEPEYYTGPMRMSPNGVLWIAHARDLVELTNPLGVESRTGAHEVKVYPNPVHDYALIQTDVASGAMLNVRLIDARGRIVQSTLHTGSEQLIIERENLPSGFYFLQVYSDEGLVGSTKLQVH